MELYDEVLDNDTLDIVKDSFDNVKTKIGMPTNIKASLLKNYNSSTLVIAAENDCLFPAKEVLPRAKKIISNCDAYMLKGRGHMHILTQHEKKLIIDFLKF